MIKIFRLIEYLKKSCRNFITYMYIYSFLSPGPKAQPNDLNRNPAESKEVIFSNVSFHVCHPIMK